MKTIVLIPLVALTLMYGPRLAYNTYVESVCTPEEQEYIQYIDSLKDSNINYLLDVECEKDLYWEMKESLEAKSINL
jgi:hypothetical protein